MNLRQKYLATTILAAALVAVGLLYFRAFPTALVYCVVAFGVIAAALENIIYKNEIIRDRYTLSGIAFGIVASAFIPSLQGEETLFRGALSSAFLAFMAYGLLTLFVEIESRYNGPRLVELSRPTAFRWSQVTGQPSLMLGGELLLWSEIFSRSRDELRIECESAIIDSVPVESSELVFRREKLFIGGRLYMLDSISDIRGLASHLSLPRESIGLGAIKAVAAFAAIFGWRGALFVFFGSAIISTLLRFPLLRRTVTSESVPLMPFLAIASIIWMFCGPELVARVFGP